MIANVPKLVLAAVIAASVPTAGSAHDRESDRGVPPVAHPVPVRPGSAPHAWRDAAWRGHELARLRAELRDLEREHAAFHARHARHPGKLRRYDREYLERRAALERRLDALRAVAWR